MLCCIVYDCTNDARKSKVSEISLNDFPEDETK